MVPTNRVPMPATHTLPESGVNDSMDADFEDVTRNLIANDSDLESL